MVFKFSWPPLGIAVVVCRALRVGTGSLTSGRIELEAMEDVFAVDWTGYTEPPASGWTDPMSDVPALTDQVVLPAPYEAVKECGSPGNDVQLAVVMASCGTPVVNTGYKVWVHTGATGWFPPNEVPFFTPSGTLQSAIDELTDEIVVVSGPDSDRVESVGTPDFAQGANVAWLRHTSGPEELIAFQDVVHGDGTLTLKVLARGCLDTASAPFPAGTGLWFMSYGSDVVNMPARAASPANTLRLTLLPLRPSPTRLSLTRRLTMHCPCAIVILQSPGRDRL